MNSDEEQAHTSTTASEMNINLPANCINFVTVTGDLVGTIKYCPYEKSCGKKPCEVGEECPGKMMFVPYVPPYWTPPWPYYPQYPWGTPLIW